MSQERWTAEDILGLMPALDTRQKAGIGAIGGRNFVFDIRGPRSIFGNQKLSPHRVAQPNHFQSLHVNIDGTDKVFLFYPQFIAEWDEVGVGGFRCLYVTPDTSTQPYRWTSAYINGTVYLCHPATGILAYDPPTGSLRKHVGIGVPELPLSICENNGRLVVIDSNLIYWSAQSDGSDFKPSVGGAGFQKIADRISGRPIIVSSYTSGLIIWTTAGALRGEFTGDQFTYRWRALNTEYFPMNSFCTIQLDNNNVAILDRRGLFKSDGGVPVPHSPLFNEFWIEHTREAKLWQGHNVRVELDLLSRHLYIMSSDTPHSPKYESAFVLYPPVDKWGVFSDSCFGIGPVHINGGTRAGLYFGYMDADGLLRYWVDSGSREGDIETSLPAVSINKGSAPYPHPCPSGTESRVFSALANVTTVEAFPDLPRTGQYLIDSQVPLQGTPTGLNAVLRLGLVRFASLREDHTQMVEVTGLALGSVYSGELSQSVDWNSESGAEDWGLPEDLEDYGLDPVNYVGHGMKLIGTIDGRTQYFSEEPVLAGFDKAQRYYTCLVPGLWHILVLTAKEPRERFHLSYFELTGSYGGKLI